MTSTGCDRRGTSFTAEVDAAIERVVAHFEENDLALRLDVLRSLSVHAKLAFEAERVRERLHQHPVTKELVERVATRSSVFEQLAAALRVDDVSCDYDAQRNAVMTTTLRWSLPSVGGASDGHKKKRRKSAAASDASAKTANAPLLMQYVFARAQTEEGETEVKLTVTVKMGDDGVPSEFVHFAMTSAAGYPRRFYEENRDMESDEEEEEEAESEQAKPSRKQSDASEKKSKRNGDAAKDDEDEDEDEDEGESYGEAIVAFRFDDKVLDAAMTWLRAHDAKHADEVDPADVIGFFLAPPVYEDEWLLDERICEILFSSGTEFGDDEEEGEADGGDAEEHEEGSEDAGDDDEEEEEEQ